MQDAYQCNIAARYFPKRPVASLAELARRLLTLAGLPPPTLSARAFRPRFGLALRGGSRASPAGERNLFGLAVISGDGERRLKKMPPEENRPGLLLSLAKPMLARRLLAAATVASIGGAAWGLAQEKSPTVIQKVQKQGDPVEFSLPTPDGAPLDAEKLRGKAVLLCFAARDFPLMRLLLRQMSDIADSHPRVTLCLVITNGMQPRDRDFVSDAELKAWRDRLHFPHLLARDPRGALLLQRLNLSVLPSFILLRKDGTVALVREGIDPATSLAEQLRSDLLRVAQAD